MRRRSFSILVGLVALAGLLAGWYFFRPELAFIDANVSEELPAAGAAQASPPELLSSGRFHGVAHEGSGLATIYQLADGQRVLRLTEFDVLNGPDLYVYLVAARDASDSATVERAEYVSLGRLKGNVGDQNYELPADLDLSSYQSVVIWCKRFSVNFATAPLQ